MKHCGLIVAALLAIACDAAAQGYTWEASPRGPHEIPRTYFGLEAGLSYAVYPARLDYIEQSIGVTCCTFDNGSGLPMSLSLVATQWLSSRINVSAGFGVSVFHASFVAPTQPVPLSTGQILQTEYVLDGSLTYATGFGSVSMRLGPTNLLATVGARVHASIGGALTQRERIVEPSGAEFSGQNPGREVVIAQTFLDNTTPVVVEPFVQIGYDIALAYGMVIQPSVSLGIPLGSLLTNDDWSMRSIGLRLRLLKGL